MKLRKHILCLLLISALMLAGSTAALAADASGFAFALNSSGTGYTVIGYTGSDTSVTVPDWHQGLRVTAIGNGAFKGNTAITSVSMPSTLTLIGDNAFSGCTNLAKLSTYAAASEPPVVEDSRVPGDANDDGAVDILDALLVLQYDAGWDVRVNAANADANADGSVDILDALLLLQYDAGWDVTLK